MSPHAFIPSLAGARRRTIFIRTRRPLWQRLAPTVAAVVAIALLVGAMTWLVSRLYATDAALARAHAEGMASGMQTCAGR